MPAVSAPMSLKQRDTPLTFTTPVLKTEPIITWEKLPDNFERPDDPVDNLTQPLLAEALRDGFLEPTHLHLSQSRIIGTNFGIAAVVNGKNVIKAPDWVYVPSVLPLPDGKEYKSYTPHAQGAIPEIVMEFLSDTEGREYNRESVYPYGKWYFYEQILKVPFYAIFEPVSGLLECYHRKKGYYKRLKSSKQGRYWISSLNLSLGVWEGTREDSDRTGYWLRWWDTDDHLLLWKSEKAEQAENEKQAALEKVKQTEAEKQAALEGRLGFSVPSKI
jgi:hypothetical protein